MKKHFPTFIHETAMNYKTIFVSAGRVGCQIEIAPADLITVGKCAVADIVADTTVDVTHTNTNEQPLMTY